MAGPFAQLSTPSSSLFKFPPSHDPLPVVPYSATPRAAVPFNLSQGTFNAALDPRLPITFAVIYVCSVKFMNRWNRKRGNKPFGFSQTNLFRYFAIVHNIFLAVYSGITCAAMIRALSTTTVAPWGPNGIAATVDSLCKIHGPPGFGNAITYDQTAETWKSGIGKVTSGVLGSQPDLNQFGRLWHEGLAFWGWWFYLSKLYEVVDSMLIVSKGKRSSTLQTYHHAGAMICMWAGIRYMAPPIWMFVTINSGIHTLMYTYYTLSLFNVRVSRVLKRTLTTMQIMQFVVGVVYATFHLFISYTAPVSVPVTVKNTLSSAVESGLSNTDVSGFVSVLKKFALYAAGTPGIAYKTMSQSGNNYTMEYTSASTGTGHTRYRQTYQMTNCLDTDGESFGIWLNVTYLFPLTALFVRFFVKSYVLGQTGKSQTTAKPRRVSQSAVDAARETTKTLENLGEVVEEDQNGEDVPNRGHSMNGHAVNGSATKMNGGAKEPAVDNEH